MSAPAARLVTTEIPARVADLAFTFDRPADWVLAELPPELPDFGASHEFAPLCVAMAPYAALVFSVGARPVFEDGTLADWLAWLAREAGYDPGPIERETGLPLPAVGCWAMQSAGDTIMRMRLVLAEDGGRLVQLATMAPTELWASVHDTFCAMLSSFRLARPRGGGSPLAADGVALPESTFTPMPVAPHPDTRAAVTVPGEEDSGPDGPVVSYAADEDPVEEVDPGALATFAEVARAADTATLQQDHELNQRLLQSGAGFAAPIADDLGPDERCADVRCSALLATLRVPYGWHVLDDGRRTLVHDGSGGVQIHLDLRRDQGLSGQRFLAALADELRGAWPDMVVKRLRLRGVDAMLLHGIVENGEELAQFWFLRPAADDRFLVMRTTCRPADLTRAGDTAELVLHHLRFCVAGEDAEVTAN